MKKISFKNVIQHSRKGFKFLVFLVAALLTSDLVLAPPPRPDPNIPIDGGILWLLLAGLGYGAKKAFDRGRK